MEHSIALVTGATSGLGHAAARLLAGEGWHEIIVTGRSLAGAQQAAAQLAAENKTVIFTALALDLDTPSSVQSALAELVKRGRPIDFLLLNAGMVPGKARVLTAAGVEGFSGPADRPSSTDCRLASRQPAEPQRADCYRRRGACPRGRPYVQLHRRASLRGQIPPG
jgi:NAD(P)-dependent dehydrogenase (short-subunit alcohol dehydrogenase family)